MLQASLPFTAMEFFFYSFFHLEKPLAVFKGPTVLNKHNTDHPIHKEMYITCFFKEKFLWGAHHESKNKFAHDANEIMNPVLAMLQEIVTNCPGFTKTDWFGGLIYHH